MKRRRILSAAAAGAVLCALSACKPGEPAVKEPTEYLNGDVAKTEAVLRADTEIKHQIVKNFGVSGAWWSTGIGDRATMDEILALLFTDKGIALNAYRHNIGGGREGGPLADDKSGPDSWRAVPCPLKADGSIDIAADANAWTVLQKIDALGTVDTVILFMNSPPESMTVNGKTYNDSTGSNLRPECYEAYAAFCADVAEAYLNAGIPVKYISPVNEPQSQWDAGWQEGCHYTTDEILKLTRLVIAELNRRNLPVKISVNESAQYGNREYVHDFYKTLLSDDTIYPYIDHFAAHAYFATDKIRAALYNWTQKVAGDLGKQALPVYQTEFAAWAPDNEALTAEKRITMTGRALYEDLTLLNVDSWDYFAALSRGPDSLVMVNDSDASKYWPMKHMWAIGNYSKFIKGYTRVEVEESSLPEGVMGSAYLAPDGKKLVFVAVNEDTASQTVTLAGVPEGAWSEVYETSMERDCSTSRGFMKADNGYALPAQSVTTFVFQLA